MTFHCRHCRRRMPQSDPDGTAFCGPVCAERYSTTNRGCAWCGAAGQAEVEATVGGDALLFCRAVCADRAGLRGWPLADPVMAAAASTDTPDPHAGCTLCCPCGVSLDRSASESLQAEGYCSLRCKHRRVADAVNHPPHYTFGTIQPLDAIEAWKLGHHEASVVKYIVRARHKGAELEDLEKAQTYLRRKIKLLRAAQ